MAATLLPPTMTVHVLPVEILSRIFVQGAHPGPSSPFLLRPHHKQPLSPQTPSLDFQILVSHVCQRWRAIALETPTLWTTLVFLEFRDIERGRALLARVFPKGSLIDPTATPMSQNQNVPDHNRKNQSYNVHCDGARPVPASKTITIVISTVAQPSHTEGVTIAESELHRIFWMLRGYLPAWRALHLIVRDNKCKVVAREHLGGCGPGLSLETLQLYHFEDFREAQDLYLATYRPPVVVFANTLPRLRNVSLIGVNLPWEKSPYLYDGRLRGLELALHADKVRPPYELWERMLRGCGTKLVDVTNGQQATMEYKAEEGMCSLEELSLHYSGPKVGEGEAKYAWRSIDDGQMYSANKQWRRRIWMPRLEKLSLTDLDPDYLCKIMETLVLPAIRKLELELPDQEFTQFVEMLSVKKGEEVILPPPSVVREDPDSLSASPDSGSILTFPSPQRTDSAAPTNGISELTLSAPALGLDSNDNLYKCALKRVDAESRTFPALWRVEHLNITALVCSADSWRGFLRALTGLRVLEIDFGRVSEEFWHVFMEREGPTTLGENKKPTVLPSLQTLKMSGLEGSKVVETIRWRSVPPISRVMSGTGVSRWFVKWSEKLKGKDVTLDDLVHNGVWVKIEGETLHKRVECWDEDEDDDDEEEELDEDEEEEELDEDEEEEEDADDDDDDVREDEDEEDEEY